MTRGSFCLTTIFIYTFFGTVGLLIGVFPILGPLYMSLAFGHVIANDRYGQFLGAGLIAATTSTWSTAYCLYPIFGWQAVILLPPANAAIFLISYSVDIWFKKRVVVKN